MRQCDAGIVEGPGEPDALGLAVVYAWLTGPRLPNLCPGVDDERCRSEREMPPVPAGVDSDRDAVPVAPVAELAVVGVRTVSEVGLCELLVGGGVVLALEAATERLVRPVAVAATARQADFPTTVTTDRASGKSLPE